MVRAIGILTLVALFGQTASARHHRSHSSAEPGVFDYYLLSLSWSPAFCLQQPESAECNGPRRFGFIVHGLWPQNESGWPANCGGETSLPERVVDDMSQVMPARQLVYHEWVTHGTCSGLAPADYFALVRQAFSLINIPAPLQRSGGAVQQAPGAIVGAFMQSNPHMSADSLVVSCSGQDVPRLREVHICLDRALNVRTCSADVLRQACQAPTVIVPPIR